MTYEPSHDRCSKCGTKIGNGWGFCPACRELLGLKKHDVGSLYCETRQRGEDAKERKSRKTPKAGEF